uniref:Uncharacterized protein n=1 Tax=Nothobranchius korthausae TaxID=1143690 RepID=A0A1A8GND0_9TELE
MSSDARPCPACQTGSISSGDLHAKCEVCLGAHHAGLALTLQASCPFCAALPVAEKIRRVEYFTPADEEIPVANTYSLDKALDFFNAGQEPAGFNRLDDVTDSEEYDEAGCHSPFSLLYNTEVDEPRSAGPSAPVASRSSLPAVRALLQELPAIISAAAARKGLAVPEPAPPEADDLAGSFGATQTRCPDPIWPRFPAAMSCWSAAFSEPARLKAPASTYAPITKVEGFSDQGCPSVPPLEPDLAPLFGARNHLASPRAVPALKHDQLLTRLTDRAHQCAFQTGAAGNNIALLAFGVSKMMEELDAPEESKAIITKTADSILNLCAAVLTSSARIAAWQTLIQRALWLKALPSIPEHLHREMLEGTITPDVLFGPHLRGVIERAQKSADRSATVRDLVHPRSASHSGRSSRGWDERHGNFKRPAAPPAPRSRPPASAPPQQDQRGVGKRFRRGQRTPSWQFEVQEPRRKQPRKCLFGGGSVCS